MDVLLTAEWGTHFSSLLDPGTSPLPPAAGEEAGGEGGDPSTAVTRLCSEQVGGWRTRVSS